MLFTLILWVDFKTWTLLLLLENSIHSITYIWSWFTVTGGSFHGAGKGLSYPNCHIKPAWLVWWWLASVPLHSWLSLAWEQYLTSINCVEPRWNFTLYISNIPCSQLESHHACQGFWSPGEKSLIKLKSQWFNSVPLCSIFTSTRCHPSVSLINHFVSHVLSHSADVMWPALSKQSVLILCESQVNEEIFHLFKSTELWCRKRNVLVRTAQHYLMELCHNKCLCGAKKC